MRRRVLLLALLTLAVPMANAADLALYLPDTVRLSEATLAAGHLEADGLVFQDPVLEGLHNLSAATATITVCSEEGGVSGTVPTDPTTLAGDCQDGRSFDDASLFGELGTDVRLLGPVSVATMPEAVLATWAGDNLLAAFAGDLGLTVDGADVQIVPLTTESAIGIVDADGTTYFNGTGYRFVVGATNVQVRAGSIGGPAQATGYVLTDADGKAMVEAMDPFRFLRLERHLLGADAVEPRANVTSLFLEYGRITGLVNGALFGAINGTVAGATLDEGTSLVSGHDFRFTVAGTALAGTYTAEATLHEHSVSVHGRSFAGPPWFWTSLFWAVAVAALVVRRSPPVRLGWPKVIWAGGILLAFVLVETWIARRLFRSGIIAEAGNGNTGALVAVTFLEVVVVVVSYFAIAHPLRLVAGRVSRNARSADDQPLWVPLAAHGGAVAVWLLFLFAGAASMVAAALLFVRV